MKNGYVTPKMTGERFVANEYVATCWEISGCLIGQGNTAVSKALYSQSGNNGQGKQGWGKPDQGSFLGYTSNGNNLGISGFEADGLPHGTCSADTYLSNSAGSYAVEPGKGSSGAYIGYFDKNGNGYLDSGDYVAWYTVDKNGTGTYYHLGIAGEANRS